MIDQGFSSLSNFGATVLAARLLNVDEFGAVAIGFAVYLIAAGVARAWTSEPLVIRYSAESVTGQGDAIARSTGASCVIAAGIDLLLLPCAWFVGGDVGPVLTVIALSLPFLLLQDSCRFALIMSGRASSAAVNDFLWVVLMVVFYSTIVAEHASAVAATVGWAAAGAICGLLGVWQLRRLPQFSVSAWYRKHLDIAPRLMAEFLIVTGSGYALTFFVAYLDGLSGAAGFRGAQTLMGPLSVLFMGVGIQALPIMVRQAAVSYDRLVDSALRVSGALVAGAAAWGIGASVMPDAVGSSLLGDSWAASAPLVPIFAVMYCAVASASGAMNGIRALGDARSSLRTRLFLAPVLIGAGVAGAVVGGPVGAAVGMTVGQALSVPAWWLTFRGAVSRRMALD